uniref:Ig-like domain-containing protein n=1 Tax=Cynoglossus semilaevis TaxID=244447 RepID=A0A3P8WJ73_CYNSE
HLVLSLDSMFHSCSLDSSDRQDRVDQLQRDVSAAEGQTVSLDCNFQTSDSSPTIQWYKQEVNSFPKIPERSEDNLRFTWFLSHSFLLCEINRRQFDLWPWDTIEVGAT